MPSGETVTVREVAFGAGPSPGVTLSHGVLAPTDTFQLNMPPPRLLTTTVWEGGRLELSEVKLSSDGIAVISGGVVPRETRRTRLF
jgi:hypothetical protein